MLAGRSDSSINFRINVWAAVREMILDRPIIGIPDTMLLTKSTHQRTRFSVKRLLYFS